MGDPIESKIALTRLFRLMIGKELVAGTNATYNLGYVCRIGLPNGESLMVYINLTEYLEIKALRISMDLLPMISSIGICLIGGRHKAKDYVKLHHAYDGANTFRIAFEASSVPYGKTEYMGEVMELIEDYLG